LPPLPEAGKTDDPVLEWDLVILRFEVEPGKASFADELFHTIYILVDAKQYSQSGLHYAICRVPTEYGDYQSITTAALQSLGWSYRIVDEDAGIPACKHIRELII